VGRNGKYATGSVVDIQYATAANRRGKKERRNHMGKIECSHLLRRAAIKIDTGHSNFATVGICSHLSPKILSWHRPMWWVHEVITGNKKFIK